MQAAFFLSISAPHAFSQNGDPAAESHRAKELMAEKRFAEAIPIYEDLLKIYPGNTGLLLNLALAEQMAGQPARAVPHFEAVLRDQPDNMPALLSLSMARMQLNQPREATPILQKVVKLHPENLNAVGMLAEAEMDQNLFEAAAAHYRELTEKTGNDARAWYGLGKAYESLAAHTFERLNRTAPQSAYVAILLADSRLQRQQYRSAFFFYHQAQSKSPDLPGIRSGLAEVYSSTGHPDWAAREKESEQKLALPNCELEAAECAFLSQRFFEATKVAMPTASPATLFWATKAYNELAVQAFDRLSRLPESVEMHAFKAQVLHDHKQNLEAANEWRAALKLAPEDSEIKRELAAALFDAKDYRAAMPLIEEQLGQEPKAPELNYLMGASLYRTEQAGKALPYLQAAVEGHTNNLAADAALGLTLVSLNKTAEAIPYLKKALPLDDDGSVHYALARACRADGRSDEANKALAEYQKIKQRNQQIDDELSKEAEITAPKSEQSDHN